MPENTPLTSKEEAIERSILHYRRQRAFNKLTCIHDLSAYELDLLTQELNALDELLAGEEVKCG